MTAGHPCGVRVAPPFTEVVFGQDIIRVDARGAFRARLLHRSGVRDESLFER